LKQQEVFGVNWIGLLRSLQAEIMGLVGALLAILVIWLVVRSVIGRGAVGVTQTRLRGWAESYGRKLVTA
jgi:hypothetical protein